MTAEHEHEHGHEQDVREENQPRGLELVEIGSSETVRDLESSGSLSSEWTRQSKDLARRFAKKLGFSEEEYITTLPEFGLMPESFRNNNSPAYPILVDTRVDWSDLLVSDEEMAKSRIPRVDFSHLRINVMFDFEELKDWEKGGSQTSSEPYAAWLTYRLNKSVKEFRAVLQRSRHIRGGTVLDVVYLYYRRPQIFNALNMNLPGSQLGHDHAPFLSALGNAEGSGRPNHPSLNRGSIDAKSPRYASLLASIN